MPETTTVGPRAFACVHGDDAQGQIDEVWAWARERLQGEESWLLTLILADLDGAFGAHITRIDTDQWSAVHAETYIAEGQTEPAFRTRIQCDRIEDGFVYTLRAFHDHYGGNRPHRIAADGDWDGDWLDDPEPPPEDAG